MNQNKIPYHRVPKILLMVDVVVALIYFSWWLQFGHVSNPWLYGLLFVGEIYHVMMAIFFWFTVWPGNKNRLVKGMGYYPKIDVFITVAGEPIEVIRETVEAAKKMRVYAHRVYILNDGYVAKKDNWQEVEQLAQELEVKCITRKTPGGAKAGNVNNALRQTNGNLVVIFDADMVPKPNFLEKMVPYFVDLKMAFVQAPQYYKNFNENAISFGSWDQQKFFFGPIMIGKEKSNAAFICGTNVVIRREALEQVGGLAEDNIAEDFYTSILVHQNGWKSHYVTQVLAEGLAPLDLLSYHKQQFRWARGSLDVLTRHNPLFKQNLSWGQKIQYLSSALYYFNGVVILIDMLMPLIYLFTGQQAVSVSTASFAIYFLPFMFLNLYTLSLASDASISLNTFSFGYASWYLQLAALWTIVTGKNVKFSVTPKQAQSGNFAKLVMPHMAYILLAIAGTIVALGKEHLSPSVLTNLAWAAFNTALFLPYIAVAFNNNFRVQPQPTSELAMENQ